MKFFRRADTTLRCLFRGAYLLAPDAERLLKSCPEAQRARVERRLSKLSRADRPCSVHWQKRLGDELRPQDVVAILRLNDIVVELACGRHGVVAEVYASEGDCLAAGARLAKIGKPAVALSRSQKMSELLAQFTSRHHHDVEQIKGLQSRLAEDQTLIDRLRAEILSLRGRQNADYLSGRPSSSDRKFRRLKLEFSKHFHPDSQSPDEAERRRRELVFQEFWPIVERIERS